MGDFFYNVVTSIVPYTVGKISYEDQSGSLDYDKNNAPTLYVSNHSSIAADALAIAHMQKLAGIERKLVPVIGTNLLENSIASRLHKQFGHIAFDRNGGPQEVSRTINSISDTLDNGKNVWVAATRGRKREEVKLETYYHLCKSLKTNSNCSVVPIHIDYAGKYAYELGKKKDFTHTLMEMNPFDLLSLHLTIYQRIENIDTLKQKRSNIENFLNTGELS